VNIKEILTKIDIEDTIEVSIKKLIPIIPASMSKLDDTLKFSDEMSIICDKRNIIIEGHGIYWWNKQNGITKIKVLYIDRPPSRLVNRVAKILNNTLKRKHREENSSDLPRMNINAVFGHSLNKINNDITNFLSTTFNITENYKKGDILLQHYVQPIKDNTYFVNYILIQPIDGSKIRAEMVKKMNDYNLIIAPSVASQRIMKESGVHKKITIIPNYYDDNDLTKSTLDYYQELTKQSNKYTFYSETTGIKRKNVDNILKFYLETFTKEDNVRLIIKLSSNSRVYNSLVTMVSQAPEDAPEVIILNQWLEDGELNSLRKGIDCYICLSYMEGFCIPLLNAVVLEKDTIALKSEYSGYMDYVDTTNANLIPTKKILIDQLQESLLIYEADSYWEEPNDYEHFKKAMVDVYEKKYAFQKNLRIDSIKSEYSRQNVMNKYENIFREYSNEINQKEIKTYTSYEHIIDKYKEGEFLNPITDDVIKTHAYLNIASIKGWIFSKKIQISDHEFRLTGELVDVNVEGQVNNLKGDFYLKVDPEYGRKITIDAGQNHIQPTNAIGYPKVTIFMRSFLFGDKKVAKFFIEIEATTIDIIPDLNKVGAGDFAEGLRIDGTLVIETGDNYVYSQVSNETEDDKDNETDNGIRDIINSTGWTDGGSAKITEIDSKTVRWSSFKLLNIDVIGSTNPLTIAGDFVVTDKDNKIVISVDSQGTGVFVQEYPFELLELSLVVQTSDNFRTDINGTFTYAHGTARVQEVK